MADVSVDEQSGAEWADAVMAELASLDNVRIMPRTTVFGVYDGVYGALEQVTITWPHHLHLPRQRMWKLVCKR